ncbi:MAG TPA: chemotaxis protein CheB [Candidatus Binatia bacterium]|nr:chemotaxis protein CheB [Candidatus Binatia bacterium]
MARTQRKSAKAGRSAGSAPRPPDTPEAALAPALPAIEPHAKPRSGLGFPIVAIGASAGGLDALGTLLAAVPTDTGMAFVVVQHLDPHYASTLAEILDRSSTMPVRVVTDKAAVEPNRVYVIPPGRDMVIGDGLLHLAPRTQVRGQHRPIDRFMRSLAEEHGHRAIGVVLSGSASDGTQGLEEIKAAGGITFAQDASAEHGGMPRSAIAAGCVDLVLAPGEIGREIGRIARHPYVAGTPLAPEAGRSAPAVIRLLDQLRQATGVDFTNYKRNTLHRRITRRIVLHKLEGLAEYTQFVQENPGELEALYQDILINVTSFFRNPESFDALKQRVFPRLTADKQRHEPVRVWVLGCSTGEEAYSIAMAFTEYAEASGLRVPLQVFATDLNGAGIERARAGIYAKGIAQDLSPERLRRFFVEVDGHYRICKPIRDMCVFARQNVLADPPFSRMDLISCRNMLIYLEPVLQQRLMPLLHFALRPAGFLWLGSSETIGSFRDLFELDDGKAKIYSKRTAARMGMLPAMPRSAPRAPARDEPALPRLPAMDPQREADRLLLARYAPAGVVVNEQLDIVQFRGDTSAYLAPSPGRASLNLVKMLRDGLLVPVRGALLRARRGDVPVHANGLRVKTPEGYRDVNVTVLPLKGSGVAPGSLLVLFEEPHQAAAAVRAESRARASREAAPVESSEREIARLKQELASTKEYLQSVIEQQEAANEELQSANEEVQSANEELQSINEELETSKEEIQSSNEELATVNDELQNRNQELSQSNNDLTNLLSSVQMAIVMLGRDLRIRRFTPAAERLFNLIPADVGRPIGDIKLRLDVPDLEPLLSEAIDTVSIKELDVQDRHGRWYSLRVRPYKTLENRIDGAVLVLVDVDSLKRAEQALRENDRSKNDFLAVLAHELRNPLAALQAATDVLNAEGVDANHLARAQQVIQRQMHNMTRMVDDLLDVSRISKGDIQLQLETVDLVEVLRAAVSATEAQREQNRQRLSLSLPKAPVELRADATRLEQVLGNLLGNAAKFTPRDGEIWLSLEHVPGDPARAVIRLRDNGIGIEPSELGRIFELFTQADRSIERRHGGLGIGLALARRLVELHGGEITAASGGRNKGCELVVSLPLVEWEAAAGRTAVLAGPEAAG